MIAGVRHVPFVSVPGHPYARYRQYRDVHGRLWIECECNRCGPAGDWRKQCQRPPLASETVYRYAVIHGHGLRPRRP